MEVRFKRHSVRLRIIKLDINIQNNYILPFYSILLTYTSFDNAWFSLSAESCKRLYGNNLRLQSLPAGYFVALVPLPDGFGHILRGIENT